MWDPLDKAIITTATVLIWIFNLAQYLYLT